MMGLHAQVVYRDIVARSYGADPIEDALGPGLPRNCVNHHIGLRQRAVYSVGCGADQFFGVFEGVAARQRQGEVGEISCSRATDTRLLHGQHSGHLLGFVNDLVAGFCRDLVHQHAYGFARKLPRDPQNHERDHDGGKRVREAQPRQVVGSPDP